MLNIYSHVDPDRIERVTYDVQFLHHPESSCFSVSLFAGQDLSAVSSTWLHTDLPVLTAPRVCKEHRKKTNKSKLDKLLSQA